MNDKIDLSGEVQLPDNIEEYGTLFKREGSSDCYYLTQKKENQLKMEWDWAGNKLLSITIDKYGDIILLGGIKEVLKIRNFLDNILTNPENHKGALE